LIGKFTKLFDSIYYAVILHSDNPDHIRDLIAFSVYPQALKDQIHVKKVNIPLSIIQSKRNISSIFESNITAIS
jgi:hypothetical protein